MKYMEKNEAEPGGNTVACVWPAIGAKYLPGNSPAWNLWVYSIFPA